MSTIAPHYFHSLLRPFSGPLPGDCGKECHLQMECSALRRYGAYQSLLSARLTDIPTSFLIQPGTRSIPSRKVNSRKILLTE